MSALYSSDGFPLGPQGLPAPVAHCCHPAQQESIAPRRTGQKISKFKFRYRYTVTEKYGAIIISQELSITVMRAHFTSQEMELGARALLSV